MLQEAFFPSTQHYINKVERPLPYTFYNVFKLELHNIIKSLSQLGTFARAISHICIYNQDYQSTQVAG